MKNNLYGIWIEPPQVIRDELNIMIHQFENKFSSLPGIVPHITLLPAVKGSDVIQMIKDVKEVVKQFSDISIKFNGLKTGESLWKSIYIDVERSGQLELLFDAFLNRFSTCLEITPKIFLPHLSLLYGHFSKEKQDEICSGLQHFKFGSRTFDFNKLFVVKEVSLFCLKDLNDPVSWTLVKRIKVG